MGKIKEQQKVRLFAGIMISEGFEAGESLEILCDRYGEIDQSSNPFDFLFTRHYESEMGISLKKSFVSFSRLIDREELPEIKVFTNQIEERFAEKTEGQSKRRINIDPGYITGCNIVLATTKEFPHRIHLGNGIFGEVTLSFTKNGLKYYEWTYEDYKTELAEKFFSFARRKYLEGLK